MLPLCAVSAGYASSAEEKVEVLLTWQPPQKYKVDWKKIVIPAKTSKPALHSPKKDKAEIITLVKEPAQSDKKTAKTARSRPQVGYYLYYADNPRGPFHRINDTPLKTLEAKVLAPSGEAGLYFAVSAVSPLGIEGPLSAGKEYTPGAPGLLSAGAITLNLSPPTLEADGKSKTKVTAVFKDTAGRPLAGKSLEFALSSAGDLKMDDDIGILEVLKAQTDKKGELEAVFRAGSVTKTALLMIQDPQSKTKATEAVRQWVELETSLTLEDEDSRGGMAANLQKGGILEVKVTPPVLPADGVSTAQIEVLIGEGVKGKVKEDKPRLTLWEGHGTLKTIEDSRAGRLSALFTAPTKPGRAVLAVRYGAATKFVTIRLKAHRAGDSSLTVKPESLPADARSKAEVIVTVKDEAGKALEGAEVHLSLAKGGGRLIGKKEGVTDAFGQARFQYRAGHRGGEAVLKAKVLSKPPQKEDWQEERFTKIEAGAPTASKLKPSATAPERKSFPFQGPSMDRPVDRRQDFIFR